MWSLSQWETWEHGPWLPLWVGEERSREGGGGGQLQAPWSHGQNSSYSVRTGISDILVYNGSWDLIHFQKICKLVLIPLIEIGHQFSSVQLLSHVRLFATPWIAARQASLSITNSQSLLKLMSIESVMPSSHLILCHPLLLLPGSSPGGSREFEVGTASARIRKQLLN